MKTASGICDSFLIDTYRLMTTGKFSPGAITFKGRKKIEIIRWDDKMFETQNEADDFVRAHFSRLGIPEAENEGEIFRMHPKR